MLQHSDIKSLGTALQSEVCSRVSAGVPAAPRVSDAKLGRVRKKKKEKKLNQPHNQSVRRGVQTEIDGVNHDSETNDTCSTAIVSVCSRGGVEWGWGGCSVYNVCV